MQANRLVGDGQLEEAVTLLERLIERLRRVPEHRRRPNTELGELFIRALWTLAQVQARRGEWGVTQALFDQVQTLAPERRLEWQKDLLLARIGAGDVAPGVQELHALAVANPNEASLWTALGWVVLTYHISEYADETAERLWELSQNTDDAHDRWSLQTMRLILLMGLRLWDKAVQAWQQSPHITDDLTETLLQVLLIERQLDLAQQMLDENRLPPIETTYHSAVLAYLREDVATARRLWRRVVMSRVGEDQPQSLATSAKIGMAHCWLGEPEAAVELLTDPKLSPLPNAAVFRTLGLAMAMLGEVEIAAEYFQMALALEDQASMSPMSARVMSLWAVKELVQDEAIEAALLPYLATS